jgi:hypothetical protein
MSQSPAKRLIKLVQLIAHELRVDAAVVVDFIELDLKRIFNDQVVLPKARLEAVETRCAYLVTQTRELEKTLASKEALINTLSGRIDRATMMILEREERVSAKEKSLAEVLDRVASLNRQMQSLETQEKRAKYSLIRNAHVRGTQNYQPTATIRIVLSAFTVIGVILAVFLILWRAGKLP